MRNWEEYQKTLDHAALYNTTCLNKYKDVHEEAFFLNEVQLRLNLTTDFYYLFNTSLTRIRSA